MVDQAKINYTIYLLTTDQDYQYAIYKIGECVKLANKKFLNNRQNS